VNTTSSQAANPIDRMSVYLCAGLASSSGALVFLALPFIVSALQVARGYSESQLGDATASFFFGIAIFALTCGWWVRRFNWRVLTAIGLVLGGASQLAILATDSFPVLIFLLALSGGGAGIVTCVTLTLFGDSDTPDRAFGINLAVQTIPGVVVLFVLPHFLTGTASDLPWVLGVLGVFTLLLLVTLPGVPTVGTRTPEPFSLRELVDRQSIKPACGLLATFAVQFGITMPYIFLEQEAASRGFGAVDIGMAISIGMVLVAVGSFIAGLVADRFGYSVPVAAGALVSVLGINVIVEAHTLPMFYLGVALFLLPANYLIAYTLGLTGNVDSKGHMTGFGTVSIFAAPIFAATIAGRMHEGSGYASTAWIGASSLVLAACIHIGLAMSVRHREATLSSVIGSEPTTSGT
jgi:MFS family permease